MSQRRRPGPDERQNTAEKLAEIERRLARLERAALAVRLADARVRQDQRRAS